MADEHLDSAVLATLQDVMEAEYPVLLDTFLIDSQDRLRTIQDALAQGEGEACGAPRTASRAVAATWVRCAWPSSASNSRKSPGKARSNRRRSASSESSVSLRSSAFSFVPSVSDSPDWQLARNLL